MKCMKCMHGAHGVHGLHGLHDVHTQDKPVMRTAHCAESSWRFPWQREQERMPGLQEKEEAGEQAAVSSE